MLLIRAVPSFSMEEVVTGFCAFAEKRVRSPHILMNHAAAILDTG